MIYVECSVNVASMKTMGERLREARMSAGFSSATKAAEAMGVTASTYRAHENGQNEYGPDDAIIYARKFGVSAAELLTGQKDGKPRLVHSYDPDAPEQSHGDHEMTLGSETGLRGAPEGSSPQIDITAGMGAGGLAISSEGVAGKHGMTFSAEAVKDYWKLPPAILVTLGLAAKDIAIFPVQGDSMQPTLDEGDVVFIDTRHRRPSPDGLYAIIDEIGGLAIKRLEVTSDPGAEETLISVMSDNPRHKTKTWKAHELTIVGRVLRKFSTVR
jgi:phage repressor protein C with HTH and peptisase S24 domain